MLTLGNGRLTECICALPHVLKLLPKHNVITMKSPFYGLFADENYDGKFRGDITIATSSGLACKVKL